MRTLGLHLFASVKGGVGKSTLAVLTAKLLADRGRHPVVLDTDVLGSSLADGLELRAPVIPERDGYPDYDAEPTGRWHDLDSTRTLRDRRKQWWEHQDRRSVSAIPAPGYINDALFYPGASGEQDCRVDAMLWRGREGDRDRYLPSSPLHDDAIRVAPYLSGNHPHFAWVRRIAWIIEALISNDDAVTDVIIDLPPGTWGITHETLVLAGRLNAPLPRGYPQWHERIRWAVVPTIVTTLDRNDRLLALEYWLRTRAKLPTLGILMNRVFESQPKIRSALRDDLPEPLRGLGIEDKVQFIPQLLETLGRLFVQGDLRVDEEHRDLCTALRLEPGASPDA